MSQHLKESDRLCKVVELSMQCCGKLISDLFETYSTFYRSVNPEFERKVNVQFRSFGWIRFQNFFKNYLIMTTKNENKIL